MSFIRALGVAGLGIVATRAFSLQVGTVRTLRRGATLRRSNGQTSALLSRGSGSPAVLEASPSGSAGWQVQSRVDYREIAKYGMATTLQFSLLAGLLKGLDVAASKMGFVWPAPLVGVLFAFLSLRSRAFSPLNNSRPNRSSMKGAATPGDVKRPSWTPPGIVFPFIWGTITLLRASSSAVVYSMLGEKLFVKPLLLLVAHLSIGDTWNTITNIEKRLGVSALVIPAVAGSVYAAVKSYGEVSRLAGLLLSPNAVWLTIASVLTFTIWRINEPAQPLYPEVGDGKSSQLRLRFLGQISATTIPNTPVLPEPKVSKPEGSVLSDRDWAIINAGLQK